MKTATVILFFVVAMLAGLSSCIQPIACFTINVPFDSIRVNKPIIFDGRCSAKTAEYFWLFQSAFDSSGSYDSYFTKSFSDTGLITVNLTVVNGNQSDFATKTFKVNP